MNIRNATQADIQGVLKIYETARSYMKDTGNPHQWADFYPPTDLVMRDLEGGNLFVMEDGAELCGVFAFFPEGDAIYDTINGEWLNSLPHAAIHRVASAGTRKGILAACVEYCLTRANNLKIDTYKDNAVMQHQLKKCGFVPCGTVCVPSLGEFIAFQLYRGDAGDALGELS